MNELKCARTHSFTHAAAAAALRAAISYYDRFKVFSFGVPFYHFSAIVDVGCCRKLDFSHVIT